MTLTNHTEQIITKKIIRRAKALDACDEGIDAAIANLGKPISSLRPDYSDWTARLFDGCSTLSNGTKVWYRSVRLHREDGPAIEGDDGHRAWYRNGKLHREDGPAIEGSSGNRFWYLNGKLHREDGPASEWDDGTREWWRNGKLHREDGPAIECANGSKQWWLNGVRYYPERKENPDGR